MPSNFGLSKSKILAHRQCPKRLWLELNRKDEAEYSNATQALFATGHLVGELATRLYDPKGKGSTLNVERGAINTTLAQTADALLARKPIFEAGFSAEGALAFADVLLPVKHKGKPGWRMVEVKSSNKVSDVYLDDVAIQAFVARQAGLPLASVALAHINKEFIYGGKGDYDGLFVENDLTAEAFARTGEVRAWIAAAQLTARKRTEPAIRLGSHCTAPYTCAFIDYCQGQEPQTKYPVQWLPRAQPRLKEKLADLKVIDLRHVPDDLLNEQQLRVKQHTLSDKTYFDKPGAAHALVAHKPPAYFLDFETIAFAVPQWKGKKPFEQVPFQFSLHRLSRTLKLTHTEYLDLTGADPSESLAKALIAACGTTGPVFVFNQGFESSRIKAMSTQYKRLAPALLALNSRLVDLLPIARAHYYHPSQQGSWSIKALLPAMVPGLSYDKLGGVQDGGGAQAAYVEAAFPAMIVREATDAPLRAKAQIEQQLRAYCRLDTFATVKVWAALAGRKDVLRLKDTT